MFRIIFICPFLWLVLAPQTSGAWGYEGHKIICEIAYQALTPKARTEVKRLMTGDSEFHNFATACIWADKVANSIRPETKGWHFLNLDRNDTRVDPKLCPKASGCVLSAISKQEAILTDRRKNDDQRREALKYLGHFMGDLHQPMHLSFADDRGGNFIPVRWDNFHDSNLHAVWDTEMIKDEEHSDHVRWKKLATGLEAAITESERRSWVKGSLLDWAQETYKITRAPSTRYLSARPNQMIELGENYQRAEQPIVNRQLQKAGVRLGAVLNSLLGR